MQKGVGLSPQVHAAVHRGGCRLNDLRRSESRQHFFGENRCNCTFEALTSAVVVSAGAPESVHLGKSGTLEFLKLKTGHQVRPSGEDYLSRGGNVQ
jgi:hypothetical protein